MNKYRYAFGWNGKLHKFSNNNREVLFSEVIQFLNKNNINYSKDDISKAIDRQSKMVTDTHKASFSEVVTGAAAILKYTGNQSVSDAEISRRASICKSCPSITQIKQCSACGTAGKIANFVSNLRVKLKLQSPIPNEVKYSYCNVCKCSLALMVVSQKDAFNEAESQNLSRPDICWMKKTSTNYTNE